MARHRNNNNNLTEYKSTFKITSISLKKLYGTLVIELSLKTERHAKQWRGQGEAQPLPPTAQGIYKGILELHKRGVWGRKSASRVQGRRPGRGSGESPQKLKHIVVYCNKF